MLNGKYNFLTAMTEGAETGWRVNISGDKILRYKFAFQLRV